MSCGCEKPVVNERPTRIPPNNGVPFTEILPGENIDCYALRGNDAGPKDDARQDLVNRIQNTSITADAQLKVDETFTLSQGPRTATSWTMSPSVPGLSFVSSTGKLSGTVDTSQEGATFQITITANDSEGVIDSRQFTFSPSKPTKGESFSLVQPYVPSSGSAKVNSGFGPRIHPISKVQKFHKGQDWVAMSPGAKGQGKIVAAADGDVCFAGSAGGYGNCIRINHKAADGKLLGMTLYAHCKQLLVSNGQKVRQGQVIALEGSTGASTGPHLHFELHLGGSTPVDPTPYIRGSIIITPPVQNDGSQPADQTRTNTSPALTQHEVNARSGGGCPLVIGSDPTTSEPNSTTPPSSNQMPSVSDCTPSVIPDANAVNAEIERALDEDGSLDAEDKKLIKFIAKIESRYNPYAKNPTSSAMGLYQMLDKIALKYHGTTACADRCDAYKATKAMIQFYKAEIKPYWNGYNASGKTTIAGKPIKQTPHSARYPSLTKGEFAYGLIHHDGVGNAVNGIDLQGVDYYRRKIRESA
jgi:murein DD-endopeptidase MepM/ murein hydrolase activator NlpD